MPVYFTLIQKNRFERHIKTIKLYFYKGIKSENVQLFFLLRMWKRDFSSNDMISSQVFLLTLEGEKKKKKKENTYKIDFKCNGKIY